MLVLVARIDTRPADSSRLYEEELTIGDIEILIVAYWIEHGTSTKVLRNVECVHMLLTVPCQYSNERKEWIGL